MTEQSITVSITSLDPSTLYSGQSVLELFDAINREAGKRGGAYRVLSDGMEQVRRIKGGSEKKSTVEPVGGIRIFVDGAEIDGAESVDGGSVTVTRVPVDEDGQAFVNPQTGDIVREVIAARREIRIVRE